MTTLCLVPAPALGQATFGSIIGTVTDATGAVVPGVSIRVTNQGTNIGKNLVTDARGSYEATHLLPGVYTVSAKVSGFKNTVNSNISLEALRAVRINVVLEVGGVDTNISVVAGAPVVETEAPSISAVLNSRALQDTPLNIRSTMGVSGDSGIFNFVLVAPTGTQMGASRYALGGARGSQTAFNVDGISANSPAYGNFIGSLEPSLESVEEIQFGMTNNNAEFGEVANVTTITKSGTNDFHGALSWYNYNGALNARSTFATKAGALNRNDGAVSVGGPIIKNKLFFFGTYELQRQRLPKDISPSVPTVAMRSGNFSGLTTVVKNPLTGQPFPGNIVPPSMLSASALRWQELFYPLPNFGASNLYVANFRNTYSQQIRHDSFDARVDYQITQANSVYARVSYKRSEPKVLESGFPPELTGYRMQVRNARQAVISDTWTLTPHLINEFKAGFSRNFNDMGGELQGQALVDMLGITGLPTASADTRNIPKISMTGFTALSQLNRGSPAENTFQFVDQITYIHGRHTIKTGTEFRPQQYNEVVYPSFGTYGFTNKFTGFGWSDFLLGLPTTTARSFVRPARYARLWFLSGFIQDEFKVSPSLTLSFGLRYEYDKPAFDKYDTVANFDPRTGSLVVPSDSVRQNVVSPLFPTAIPIITAQQAGFPTSTLRGNDTNNFQPRFGFAYRLSGKARSVVRGGYGIFNDDLTAQVFKDLYSGPFEATENFTNSITSGTPLLNFTKPFLDRGTLGSLSTIALAQNLRNPYVQQWNLTIERDLGFRTGLRISYIGTRSVNLIYGRNINQPPASLLSNPASRRPFPAYNTITMRSNGGGNSYNALSTELERKWSNGLSFNSAWTWAKNLSDVDETGNIEGGTTIENAYDRSRERGNARYTPRHRLITSAIWELPMGAGKRFLTKPGLVNHIAGGWQLSAAYIAQTGEFLTPSFSGSDPSNTNTIGGLPDRIGDGNLPTGQRSINGWFDATAFAVPRSGRFGNSGRGILAGPGRQTLNLGLFKSVRVWERGRLRFQASFTNALNHPNYDNPSLNISTPASVGKITAVQSYDLAGPRTGMLGVRYEF